MIPDSIKDNLIPNAADWWKLWSVRIFAAVGLLPVIWQQIPDDIKASLPPSLIYWTTSALAVAGIVARVIQQSKLAEPLALHAADARMSAETLRQKQSRFMRLLPRLIDKAHELGFELTIGDGYRDPRVFGPVGVRQGYGESRSAHKQRLAIDLNLFKGDAWLTSTEAHRPLGEFWESLGGAWGGRFNDGNHYSLEHNGIK